MLASPKKQGLMKVTHLDGIKAICESYIAKVTELERKRKPADGLFGIGSMPADDPCHDRFAADMESALSTLAGDVLSSQEVCGILSYVYHLPCEHKEPVSIYWMLCAVHGYTLPLIHTLDATDRKLLCSRYASDFRPWERLPVQKQVYNALKKSS